MFVIDLSKFSRLVLGPVKGNIRNVRTYQAALSCFNAKLKLKYQVNQCVWLKRQKSKIKGGRYMIE